MARIGSVVLLVAAATFAGCGEGARPWAPQPVEGKITYEDGSVIPVKSLRLTFTSLEEPKDSKTHPRPGSVSVNVADGTFKDATTYKYADGLIPGRHKVSVTANDDGRDLSPRVPKEYAYKHTTPLEIDTANQPLHIKVRKP